MQDLAIGFPICSEGMFNEWARYYGRQGANLIAVPRATGGHERWVVAPRMAAIASGAFVLSSDRAQDHVFGGRGLVVSPDGDVLASNSGLHRLRLLLLTWRRVHEPRTPIRAMY